MRQAVWILTLLFVCVSVSAIAQETTSSLRGTVVGSTGAPLPGVQVEADGPLGKLTAITDANGEYRFPRAQPGEYQLTARLQGFQDSVAGGVRVTLGEAMTVDLTMQEQFGEEIIVYSDTIGIDFTESQTATSIYSREIDFLPRGRDFTDVVTFAAGAVYDNQGGGIMIDGASGLENRFVIDGVNTTDPQKGDSSVAMRAEFMEEVQVKSAGYQAEFGGALGGVINAVTRSGGNDFHGSLLVEVEDSDWNGSARPQYEIPPCTRCEGEAGDPEELVTYDKDDERRLDPGFSLGGPIVRDRFWFFVAYQPGFRTTDRAVVWVSHPPDTYHQDYRVHYAVANLTANLGSRWLFKAGLSVSPYTLEGFLPDRNGRQDLPDQSDWAPLGTEGERETYHLSVDWIAGDDLVFSARGGSYRANVVDTGIPLFDLIHNYSTSSDPDFLESSPDIPEDARHGPGWMSDNLQTLTARNLYERVQGSVDGTWYFSGAGDHALKIGYQAEETSNDVREGYNADRILYYWNRVYETARERRRGTYGYFRLLNISILGEVAVRNDAIFVQDAWQLTPRLTLNLGLRSEHEQVPNYGVAGPDPAIEFGWGDKVAPRVGFAWDVAGDSRWKLYGSYGVYYDVTKYEMPRSFFGGDKWVDFFFTLDDPDIYLNDPATGCSTGSNTVLENPTCGAGRLIDTVDNRLSRANPAVSAIFGYPAVDPGLKPMESWEAQIGVDHQLTSVIQVGARYVHKDLVRAIEDVGVFEGLPYVIGNPGEGTAASFVSTSGASYPYPTPVRQYDALELTFNRRFSDGWSLRAYYTLSRLWGNYPGLVSSDEQMLAADLPLNPEAAVRRDPNISTMFDWPHVMYDRNAQPVYGRLATDRTHQLRAQFLYDFDFGLTVGVTQFVASGAPRSELAGIADAKWYGFFPYGRGNLGDTPWKTQTDLSLWQRFDVGGSSISVGLTVLNLFDEDTGLRYVGFRSNWLADPLPLTIDDFFSGFDYESLAQSPTPSFDQADIFQPPRQIRITLKYEF